MLNQIKSISSQKTADLEYLKKSKLPLILFGAGLTSLHSYTLLKNNDIKIDYVVVDDEFYCPNMYYKGIPIQPISSVLQGEMRGNVVFAFVKNKEKILKYSLHQNVVKCVCFDNFYSPFDDINFFDKNFSDFEKLYSILSDNLSRQVFIAYLKARKSECSDELCALKVADEDQYFPPFLNLTQNEIFIDCGAYNGDTLQLFKKHTNGKYDKVYAFECDATNLEKLKEYAAHDEKVEISSKACYSENTILSFLGNDDVESKIVTNDCEKNTQVEAIMIDVVMGDEKVSFIKMDIEGAELEALKGAKNTIKKNKPKLAISIYHKQEDLITIPFYILSLNENYKFYLRHYGEGIYDTVLFAIDE